MIDSMTHFLAQKGAFALALAFILVPVGAQTATIMDIKEVTEIVTKNEKDEKELPEGSIVTTRAAGEAVVEVFPGITIKLMPLSEITIGEVKNDGVNNDGEAIPQANISVSAGTMIVMVADEALNFNSLLITTPRGTILTSTPGIFAVIVTGEPAGATVTVACGLEGTGDGKGSDFKGSPGDGSDDRGTAFVTTNDGDQIIVPGGTAVILNPDGSITRIPLAEVPGIFGIVDGATTGMTWLRPPVVPPTWVPPRPPDGGIPPNQPPVVPTPVPRPPTPTPSPSPAPISP